MKKFSYLLLVVAFALTSCTPKAYQITGTVEGSADGEEVILMERVNRQFNPLDTAVISGGKFTFTGIQNTPVHRYLVYQGEDDMTPLYLDFFLENGRININMVKAQGEDVISGTPTNDAYHAFRTELNTVFNKQKELMTAISSATPEEREAKIAEANALDSEIIAVIKGAIQKNINTPLSVFLLNSYNHYMSFDEVEQLVTALPEQYQNDKSIIALKEKVEIAKTTAVGKPFVDFEMHDPQGNPVKLSDFAGRGKLVLVDFWASWCPPCRRDMPKLVEAYAKYKGENFEIVGVSLDRTAEAWLKGLEELGMTWPQMSDLKYWESEAAKLYAIRSIPHVVLIDGEGTIIARGLSAEELHTKLAELLNHE